MALSEAQARWRNSFLQALQIVGKAVARLPFGVSDPVLCGGSAVDLYTGGLWPARELELLATEPRPVRAELMALGFHWTERPPYGERGLWHPGLEFGVTVSTGRDRWRSSAQANILTVVLDVDRDGSDGAGTISLSVIGIEDLITDQIMGCREHGVPQGEAAALIGVLVRLGWAGVGGRFRACYLQRRLLCETQGEVALEPLPLTAGFDDIGPRTIRLSTMDAVIGAWRMRCGLPYDASGLFNVRPANDGSDLARGGCGETADEEIRPALWTAQIIPFGAPLPRLPV
jgi:hypothetical protein